MIFRLQKKVSPLLQEKFSQPVFLIELFIERFDRVVFEKKNQKVSEKRLKIPKNGQNDFPKTITFFC